MEILSSISYAKRIQDAILPSVEKIESSLSESFFLYRPKDIVSGDFYWTETVGDLVFWAAVDCTGHGVPGAFMSIIGSSGLKTIIIDNKVHKPSEILNMLTEHVQNSVSDQKDGDIIMDGMDIALCCWNKKTNVLEFAGAHNPIYIIRDANAFNEIDFEGKVIKIEKNEAHSLIEIKGTNRPIGTYLGYGVNEFQNHTFKLLKGDVIYIFSDGYADQFGGVKDKKFGYKRFKKVILEMQNLSMNHQKEKMNVIFDNWIVEGDSTQIDDVCVIGVKIN